jgi:MoaA/NifB/PqqE/SkfB family radical SAM enzyme
MMEKRFEATVDESGRLVIPESLVKEYGLVPGAKIRLEGNGNGVHLRRPVTQLARVYVEPTNRCNLDCVTCIRHSWNEPMGEMSSEVFSRIIEGLKIFSPKPSVFLGGLGEPLAHPNIVDMVSQTKALGCSVELITNATLLTKSLSKRLIDAGLDILWVSLDGATPESYRDVRLGGALPEVISNLQEFRKARWTKLNELGGLELLLRPQLGVEFVAMKRNIDGLPNVLSLARSLGAIHFLVTNVQPYTPEIQEEILYSRAISDSIYTSAPLLRSLDFPKMDVGPATREAFFSALRGDHFLSISGGNFAERNNQCPFIEKGSMSFRWDGDASPCLALLHDHKAYVHKYERTLKRQSMGNVLKQSVEDIWTQQDYVDIRKRIQEFNFSPCILCGGCELFESNQEDCIGSPALACGGCLWAQGIIRCP